MQRADDDAGLWVDPQAADAAFLLEEVVRSGPTRSWTCRSGKVYADLRRRVTTLWVLNVVVDFVVTPPV